MTSGLNEQRWEWSDELDAVVAAPAHHHVLLENERVRVLETRIVPGDATPVHTHRWPNVQYVLSGADFVRYDRDGGVALDTRAVWLARWAMTLVAPSRRTRSRTSARPSFA